MLSTAQLKTAVASAFLEHHHHLYLLAGNPIHVWAGYEVARGAHVPIPDWVLEYLDAVASMLTKPAGPSSPQAVAEALGFATKGGPSKRRQAETDQRHLGVATRILALNNLVASGVLGDEDLKDHLGILQRVADEQGLSLERVQAIYYAMTGSTPGPPVIGRPAKRRAKVGKTR